MQKQVTNTITVDDFDGETPAECRIFSLPGVDTQYEIDLSEENWTKVWAALETVQLAHDRAVPVKKDEDEVAERRAAKTTTKQVSAKRRSRSNGKTAQVGPTSAEVRAWAQENSVEVPKSGRVPKAVFDAYSAAHAG